ncbi:hypothetical protein M409DRAFT_26196 [Zasmidium cellare ATCC 36951]|uniref:Uncharacterized protein n=1 Tax=Zasmidium cellare ATCC 36951 TaxID=1080233 RepID=A0A6A6C8S9_ZASCE|nr:uncharacterized protein M409DRAFT_26196 [Zasmidium cellare ATCC 36951]KAF2163587.1 hypothetical protein M409DRAFT_26196 [Zasmidium cellare ATCC 36951]
MAIIKRLGQGVGVVVGLGQEAYAHNQAKKANDAASTLYQKSRPDGKQNDPHEADDKPPPYEEEHEFVAARDAETLTAPGQGLPGKLPAPVIIPQKRPNAKARGFLTAYAPALADCGVDQETFLQFIDGFDASKQNGAFNVLNLAVAIGVVSQMAAFGPSLTVHLAAMAVHLSIESGKNLYINKKTNDYLDMWNATHFKPHGLFAMIMTYEPNSNEASKLFDLDTQVSEAASIEGNGFLSQKFSISSGTSTEAQLPEVCPLVFPDTRDQGDAGSFKRAMAFTADYFDRRSQASYAAKNPNSKLNVVDRQFAGRYADPTTFEHSGLIGVLSGGAVDPCRRHWEEEEEERRKNPQPEKKRGGLLSSVRQRLREGVLYLLIVNMPSASELREAARLMRS